VSTLLEDRTETRSTDEDDKVAHYAETASVTEGYVLGTPVIALCGEIFVPSRDPEKFPVCPICKEIVDALLLGAD
jgi:hypothetical protein|tara:strand:- start:1076 stop:1300 length:225 start_codon:yes stop_codon:yes gene_type:complete